MIQTSDCLPLSQIPIGRLWTVPRGESMEEHGNGSATAMERPSFLKRGFNGPIPFPGANKGERFLRQKSFDQPIVGDHFFAFPLPINLVSGLGH